MYAVSALIWIIIWPNDGNPSAVYIKSFQGFVLNTLSFSKVMYLSNKTITEVKPLLIVLVGSEIRSSLFGWGQLPSWGNSGSEWGLHFWPYQCWKVTKEQLSRPFSPFSDRNFLIYGTFYYFHFPNTSSVGEFFAQTPRCPRLLL